jgi:trehalose 6-phosphate phosphatase
MGFDDIRALLPDAAIMLDFDGTLSPIVAEPADARPAPGVAAVLGSLVDRAVLVAVVTGRPEGFVRQALDVPKLEVIGLYGLEGAPPIPADIVAEAAQLVAGLPGTQLEDKRVSLAVHVRSARDPDAAHAVVRTALSDIAARSGLVVFEGKRVVELGPPGSRKGAAVAKLLARANPRAALYAGDDLEDREAFAAIARHPIPTCAVAVVGAETPEELRAAADLTVAGPGGLLDLLRSL